MSVIDKVITCGGDLSKLSVDERAAYYKEVCASVGLNPLSEPFKYIVLNGKLTLYATKSCTEQLRKINGISLQISSAETIDGVHAVRARATDKEGRIDESIGAVSLIGSNDEGKYALTGDALANAYMKAECVPLGSEILTQDGWKTYDNLVIGEKVLAYDCATDTCRWVPLQNVSVYENAELVRMYSEKGQFEAFCTPDHSWAVKKQSYKERSTDQRKARGPYSNRQPDRQLIKTSEINTARSIIIAAPEVETTESLLTPTEAAILGWAVTDGTIKTVGNSVRIGICQSKEENFEAIRTIVKEVHPDYKESVTNTESRTFPMSGRTYATKPQHWWYLPADISRNILNRAGFKDRSDLPRIVTQLNHSARKAMLEAMMLAEGDKRRVFANGNPHILAAFQILCALEGYAVGSERKKDTIKTIRLKKKRHLAGSFLRFENAGNAAVWCPTTSLGTWIMRQNGRVIITGNTKAKRRVTLSISGLGYLDETEIETIPEVRFPEPEKTEKTEEKKAKADTKAKDKKADKPEEKSESEPKAEAAQYQVVIFEEVDNGQKVVFVEDMDPPEAVLIWDKKFPEGTALNVTGTLKDGILTAAGVTPVGEAESAAGTDNAANNTAEAEGDAGDKTTITLITEPKPVTVHDAEGQPVVRYWAYCDYKGHNGETFVIGDISTFAKGDIINVTIVAKEIVKNNKMKLVIEDVKAA